MITLRRLMAFASCFVFLALGNAQGQTIKVTLLGTGSPLPAIERFGPSILVEAGDQKFLFDAGRGALQRLTQAKVKYREIQGLFFTHLHSDHVVGFPDLWLTGWLTGQRVTPLLVWGPTGTKKMTANLEKAFEYDIKARISDNTGASNGIAIKAGDIKEGVIFEENGVKMNFPAELSKTIIDYHTTPEQAGEIFSVVKPRMAIFSHIIQPIATEKDILPLVRKNYTGAVELGEDLMVIDVGEEIRIQRFEKDRRN